MTRQGAKYKRISADREGRELGVTRQDEDLDTLAARLGVTIAPEHDYTDNDLSASTRSRKTRPAYQRMLKAARAGEFEVILAYTSGRITRKPRENEDLIELGEQYGIEFQYVRSPSFDLKTSNGRKIARMLAANDAGEAEDISERVSRAAQQRAEAGEWHGGTLMFGLRRKGKVITVDPAHGKLLKDAAKRVLRGESLYSICDDWNARGVRTQRGNHWRGQSLRATLRSPSIIGKREYGGKLIEAPWPAILDETTWRRIRDLTSDPERRFKVTTGSYEGKRALNGLVWCQCGQKLVGQLNNGQVRMICHKQATGGCGSVVVRYDPLESFLLDLVFARIDSPEFQEELARRSVVPDDVEQGLRDELDRLDERRRGVADALEVQALTKAEAAARVRDIEQQRVKIQTRLRDLARDHARDDVTNSDDARRLWVEAGANEKTTRQRRFLATFIESVTVKSFPPGLPRVISRRRGESDVDLQKRRDENDRAVMRARVAISWRR